MTAQVSSREDLRSVLVEACQAADEGREWPWVIEERATGRLAGSTRYLDISWAHRSLEIGWTWLAPEWWGRAVNLECKRILLAHAFERLDCVRVQLKTDARNLRSQKAIERLGAVREGVLRHHRILPDGYRRDSVYYSILSAEWPMVKERLDSILREPLAPAGSRLHTPLESGSMPP